MVLVLFHLTLFVLLASILTAATCLSAFLVSRKRLMLYLAVAFLFYFLDIALIFQDEFIYHLYEGETSATYLLSRSIASLITGLGLLISFWLLVCDYLDERRRLIQVLPGVIFVGTGLAILLFVSDSSLQRFWFYSLRAIFVFWMLIFGALHYLTSKDEVDKGRIGRHRGIALGISLFTLAVLLEDVYFFLILDQSVLETGPLILFGERNYSEELLMLFIALFACRAAYRVLSLRFERPPMHGDERQEQRINENLMSYAKNHKLSEREREVLYLILLGKDNQNIASSMQLALSTVKVHVHNILQKTGRTNRQDLIQDFWKTS